MTNSQIFKKAHNMTRLAKINAAICGVTFNYQVTFSFYLKSLINSQPQKVIVYNSKKLINKSCALVGDYVKPKEKTSFAYSELLILIMAILLNPFSLLIYNSLYLKLF
jgi:hypothetical protein